MDSGRDVVLTDNVSHRDPLSVGCVEGLWQTTLNQSGVPDGPITFTVNHQCASGRDAAPATRAFIKATVAPLVNFVSPAAGELISSLNQASFTVTGTCSESHTPVQVTGAISSSAPCTAGACSVTSDLTSLPDGTIQVHAGQFGAGSANR